MARKIKKLKPSEIRTKKRTIVRNIHSLLTELERLSTVETDESRFPEIEEEEWIEENFFEYGGVFDILDTLTEKIASRL
jgi:hypothetical protein